MPQPSNTIVLACAGSRKTTFLVDTALEWPEARILFTTYTLDNHDEIRRAFVGRCGQVPPHVTLMTWYALLLQHGVRPYQSSVVPGLARIESIFLRELTETARWAKRATAPTKYFCTKTPQIFRDRVAEFVSLADKNSGGRVINRLEGAFDLILVDEVQDMAGYDLDLLDLLFQSSLEVICVGDPRQATYMTHNARKHPKYRGVGLYDWFNDRKRATGLVRLDRTSCFRCNQDICTFADRIFPNLPRATSENRDVTGHDGVFFVHPRDAVRYCEVWQPQVLRYDRTSNTKGLAALNFGQVKGRTFDRVLIFPTKKIEKYLATGDPNTMGAKEKLYVAITRARHSTAIVWSAGAPSVARAEPFWQQVDLRES